MKPEIGEREERDEIRGVEGLVELLQFREVREERQAILIDGERDRSVRERVSAGVR